MTAGLVPLAVLAAACSSPSPAPPAVSFQNDLLPQFESSCGLSTGCHQEAVTDPRVQRVFLGCRAANPGCMVADAGSVVYSGLLGVSQELPTLPYVAPRDPTKSFLLYKLDGNLSALESSCRPVDMDPILQSAAGEPQPPGACGAPMPFNLAPTRELASQVRAWITAGGQEN